MGGGELRVFLLCHLATPLSTFFKWTAANTGSWERGQGLGTKFDWPCLFEFGYVSSTSYILHNLLLIVV